MIAVSETATVFDIRTPYLKQGQSSDFRARTEALSVLIKVYAEGGENRMHHHAGEDHGFVVLEGQATFHIESDDDVTVVGPYQGVMIPHDVNYWFQCSSEENLVMLRIGATLPGGTPGQATYPDGRKKSAEHEPWGKIETIERPGPGFGS